MNRILHQAGPILALSCLCLCISCGSKSSSEPPPALAPHVATYMICFSSPESQVVRLSAAFQVKPSDQVEVMEEPWAKDFRRYIGQSGNEGGISVTCTPVSSKDPEGALKDKADSLTKAGHKVIQTNWKYAGG
jgi:hypothetical protein